MRKTGTVSVLGEGKLTRSMWTAMLVPLETQFWRCTAQTGAQRLQKMMTVDRALHLISSGLRLAQAIIDWLFGGTALILEHTQSKLVVLQQLTPARAEHGLPGLETSSSAISTKTVQTVNGRSAARLATRMFISHGSPPSPIMISSISTTVRLPALRALRISLARRSAIEITLHPPTR